MVENSILIVDDEPNIIAALRRTLIDEQFRIYSAGDASEGLKILRTHPVNVVMSDEKMPGISGSEFLSIVKRDFPDAIRIMLTGHASVDTAMRAVNEGEIYRFLTKPWEDLDLRFAVQAAIEKYNLEEENRRLLKIVRNQALNLKLAERQFPGITKLDRDRDGRILLPDVSEEEIAEIISRCEADYI